jgi:nicotinamidase/pyrazinamidase
MPFDWGVRRIIDFRKDNPERSREAVMTSVDRRLFVFGLCGTGMAVVPVGRIHLVFAATKILPDERSVLIVVDVQNCFLPGGSLAVKNGEQVVPIINRIARTFRNVVLTQDWHTPDHISFASTHPGTKPFETIKLPYGDQVLWPDHCVQGTSSADISKDISIPHAALIVRKGYHKDMDSYSAFFEANHKTPTGLGGYLNQRGIDKAFVTGLATDFCVAWTAIDARSVGLESYVVEDACRGINANDSLAAAWAAMEKTGVKRITSEDFAL